MSEVGRRKKDRHPEGTGNAHPLLNGNRVEQRSGSKATVGWGSIAMFVDGFIAGPNEKVAGTWPRRRAVHAVG